MDKSPTNNGIKDFIMSKETKGFKQIPTIEFYKGTEIGQKRWGQIFRNEKPATIDELRRLSEYFNIDINQFLVNSKSTTSSQSDSN